MGNGKSLGQRIKNKVTLGAMSQEQLAAYWKRFSTSVGFGDGIGGKDSFDNYLAKKINGVDGFANVKGADDKPISDKLKTDPTLVTDLKTVFDVTTETTAAKDEFNKILRNMERKIKNPGSFEPGTFRNVLLNAKADAVAAMAAQQKKEEDALKAKFDNPAPPTPNAFRTKIKTTMGLTTEEEVDKVKEDMLGAMKKSHAAETKKLEGELNESVTKFSNVLASEFDRISLLGDRYERDKRMRAAIDKIAKDKLAALGPHTPTTVGIDADKGMAHLKDVRVQDLPFINTITGKTLNKTGESSYSLQLSKDWIFFDRKFRDVTKSVEKDLASLAHTIKACGEETITMDINCKDPDKAKELGKKAYEACIKAGFEPRDIKINVNGELLSEKYDAKGKLTSGDKLFKDEPDRLVKAKREAGEIVKERAGRVLDTPTAKTETAKLKKELLEMPEPDPTVPRV